MPVNIPNDRQKKHHYYSRIELLEIRQKQVPVLPGFHAGEYVNQIKGHRAKKRIPDELVFVHSKKAGRDGGEAPEDRRQKIAYQNYLIAMSGKKPFRMIQVVL